MAEQTTATETVIRGREWTSDAGVLWVSVEVRCSECAFVSFTAAPVSVVDARVSWIADHLRQHAPGRALDIEVDWEPVASCSVCPDGIGGIEINDSESLRCAECGTAWDMDGKGGERHEDDV